MTGTPNGAVAASDDDGSIPADLLADGDGAPAAETPEVEASRKAEAELAELRSQNAAQRDMILDLNRRGKEQSDTLAELLQRQRDMDKRSSDQEDRGWAIAEADLHARIERAAADADAASVKALTADLSWLLKNRPAAAKSAKDDPADKAAKDRQPAAETGKVDPAVLQWVDENPWFNTDIELHQYARARDDAVGRANPNMPMRERLAKVKEQVLKRFPDKFPADARSADARNAPAAVSRPGAQTARTKPKGKTEADLPEGARVAMAKFVKQGVLTKEQYLKDYQWDSKD